MPIYTYICTYEIISKLYSQKHCKQWEHYEVKSGEAYFSVSHQRKTVQVTPYRKQAVWNIYRFCQKFVLSMAQTSDQVSWWPTNHRLATNNLDMCETYRMVFLFCNLNQPFAHVTDEGRDAGVRAVPCPSRLRSFAPCEGWRIWTGKHLK